MRQYFPLLWYNSYPLHARGPGLCPFLVRWSYSSCWGYSLINTLKLKKKSVICYQDGCLMAFAKGALPEECLSHNFDDQCLGGH